MEGGRRDNKSIEANIEFWKFSLQRILKGRKEHLCLFFVEVVWLQSVDKKLLGYKEN